MKPIYKTWIAIPAALWLLVFAIFDAKASDVHILLGSYHEPRRDWCEFNPGIGYTNDNNLSLTAYKNSYCDLSIALSVSTPVASNVAIKTGLVTGYPDWPVLPYSTIEVQVGYGFIGLIPAFIVTGDKDYIFYYGISF